MKEDQTPKNNNADPIIFIGTGRCGSTLIFGIISHHEQLAWPPNFTDQRPYLPVELNLARRIFPKAFKPAENFKLWNKLTPSKINFRRDFLVQERTTKKEADKIRNYFFKVTKYQGKKRLAFKITGPSRIGYLKSIFPNAVFIQIIRDPLPTISSWINVSFWKERGMHQLWWRGAYTSEEQQWAVANKNNPVLLAALQYKKIMEVTNKEVKDNNVQCLTVKYEDFIQNPKKEIGRILSFSNLNSSPFIDEYLKEVKIFNSSKDIKKSFTEEDIINVDKIINGDYSYTL